VATLMLVPNSVCVTPRRPLVTTRAMEYLHDSGLSLKPVCVMPQPQKPLVMTCAMEYLHLVITVI